MSAQTASTHLARLAQVDLVAVDRQGRHRYHRLAGPHLATLLEGLMQHAARETFPRAPILRTGPRDAALREARTCYDHLAGRVGVLIADACIAGGLVEMSDDAGLITDLGIATFSSAGILGASDQPRRARVACRPCLDWSERRPHLAGYLGTALCRHALATVWVRRSDGTRAVTVTTEGRTAFQHLLDLRL